MVLRMNNFVKRSKKQKNKLVRLIKKYDVIIQKYFQVEETLKLMQQQMAIMMEQNLRDTSTSMSQVHPDYANDADD